MSQKIETERKFLIEYPNIEVLSSLPDARVIRIMQIYLLSADKSVDRRVRRSEEGERVVYTLTEKRRISALSRTEDEREISASDYIELLRSADGAFSPVIKTRVCIPFRDHVAEVDVYEGITDFAIAEIEMRSEDDEVSLPPCLSLIREVTGENEYTNRALAKREK